MSGDPNASREQQVEPFASSLQLTEQKASLLASPALLLMVISAAIGFPIVLSLWAPLAFAIAWSVLYGAVALLSTLFVRWWPVRTVNEAWGGCVGVLLSSVPISLAVWGDVKQYEAVLIACAIAHIASDATIVPYMPTYDWRLGPGLHAITTALVIGIWGTALLTVPFVLIVVSLMSAGNRVVELTHSLDRRRASAENAAIHDALTGTLNRRGVVALLDSLRGQTITVLMVDADRFKAINDTWGLGAGDDVLKGIGAQLASRLGSQWTLGRIGGDEFVAVASGAHAIRDSLFNPITVPVTVHTRSMTISVQLSGGLSTVHQLTDSDHALGEASYALRAAKGTTASQLVRLDGSVRDQFDRAMEVTAGVDVRFGEGRFVAVAQSIVNGGSENAGRNIVGFELLARWHRPDGSTISPADFLPVLRQNGALSSLGNLMLQKAVHFAAELAELSDDPPFVSINIAPSQLVSSEFVSTVAAAFDGSGVDPKQILIEVTESEDLHRVEAWEQSAEELRAIGVGLAIDDFGVGYSTIERIAELPVTHIKLDRVFSSSDHSALDRLTAGVVGFCKESGLTVIAEGIETAAQRQRLSESGVDLMQGWLFSHPESLEDAANRYRYLLAPALQ